MSIPSRQQIEFRAQNIIERVKAGQPIEDSLAELKAIWIDPKQAARRIAGHANAARGEPILWLMGVDEITGVVGAMREELANWYPAVQKEFNEVAPELLMPISIPVDSVTVIALLIETDGAPYVVNNPVGGAIQFEVPWRAATGIRSAKRSDLLRILIPRQRLPDVEVLSGELRVQHQDTSPEVSWLWNLEMGLYITPSTRELVCIPFHRCAVALEIEGMQVPFDRVRLTPPYWGGPDAVPLSRTIEGTEREVLVHAPGELKLYAGATMSPDHRTTMLLVTEIVPHRSSAQISVRLQPTHTDLFVPINASFQFTPGDMESGVIKWKLS